MKTHEALARMAVQANKDGKRAFAQHLWNESKEKYLGGVEMKPDWKDAPEWAGWLAMDSDGKWFFYPANTNLRIHQSGEMWCHSSEGVGAFLSDVRGDDSDVFWKDSLEPRPRDNEKWPTDDRIDIIGQNGNDGEHYPGRKDDTEKPMMNLIPAKAEMALARVLSFGAKKYAPENWRLVDNPEHRYMAAAMRHMNAHRSGELRDKESGELHLSHALTCLAFLVELEESK